MTTVTTQPAPVEALPAEAYARVFENNPEGAAVLQDLVRRFARGPVLKGGIDGIRENDHRGGQRSVTEFIVSQINRASGFPDPQE
jgi:hypothetical protein